MTPQDFRTAAMILLPLSFGWKLFKFWKDKRAPRYVFTLSESEGTTKMMSDDKARSMNRWRSLLRRPGTWQRQKRTRR